MRSGIRVGLVRLQQRQSCTESALQLDAGGDRSAAKCRIYEMTDNKTARSTIAYLIVRDHAHENAFAKALESLGVDRGKVLPIPKTTASGSPR